jgi:hypothetical protein
LRRWPQETGYTLQSGIDGDDSGWRRDCIKAADAPAYEGGEAIAINWAQLSIGGKNYQHEIDANAQSVTFSVELKKGADQLFAAFYDDKERTLAPYYVYVRRSL